MHDQFSPTVWGPTPEAEAFQKPFAGDEQLFVVFFMDAIQNEGKSITEGRPIFDDVECLRIIVPGDRNNVVVRPASAQDKQRFAKQYGMFKQGMKEEDQITGTRLTDWPFLTRGQCEELRYVGVRTVEQLAEVRDDVALRFPGLVSLKKNAHAWLGKAKNSAEAAMQQKTLDDQKSRIDSLEHAVREQAAIIEKLKGERAKA